jgi:hypothetical protein
LESSKIVDDIVVHVKYQADRSPKTCFIVFSSREKHVEVLIDWIEAVFADSEYQLVRLDEQLKSGDSQYQELTDQLASCSFAIVVLDGFRPNVLFEYGILKGLKKPCIVLLEQAALVDIQGYYADASMAPKDLVPIDTACRVIPSPSEPVSREGA